MLGTVPLPIPPSSLDISTPSTNMTVTLINDGEINIPKPPGLREISFDFLLPTFQKYPFATYQLGDYTATSIILYIRALKEYGIPIPFIVVRMSPAGEFLYFTTIMSLVEDFTFNEDAENYGFDTNCSIKLKEYVFYGTRRVEIKKTQNGTKTASVKKTRSTADRVKKSEIKPKEGESLMSACKREGYDFKDVCNANNIKTPTTRAVIYAHDPELQKALNAAIDGAVTESMINPQVGIFDLNEAKGFLAPIQNELPWGDFSPTPDLMQLEKSNVLKSFTGK